MALISRSFRVRGCISVLAPLLLNCAINYDTFEMYRNQHAEFSIIVYLGCVNLDGLGILHYFDISSIIWCFRITFCGRNFALDSALRSVRYSLDVTTFGSLLQVCLDRQPRQISRLPSDVL